MKGKSPAFQFYPKDWLSSASVSLMTPAEEGAYIRLLAIAWMEEDCGLPDDDEALAMLSRLGRQWHGKSGQRIRARFTAMSGRLFNDRLLEERQKQLEWKEKSSEGGKKSAAKRATNAQPNSKGGSRVVEECLQPKPNIAFASSFATAEETEEHTQRAAEPAALAVVAPPKRPRKPHRTIEEVEQSLGDRKEWWGWFWKAYPCHEGKRDAIDAYERIVASHELAVEIYKGAQRYAAKVAADPTIRVKWAQGWLNAERWKDEIDVRAAPSPSRQRDLVANVSREIQESLLKGEQPW